jgi:hypothetical protein
LLFAIALDTHDSAHPVLWCTKAPGRLDDECRKGMDGQTIRQRVVDTRCSACTAPISGIDAASIAATHIKIPRDRKPVIVPAAVKGEALSRRPNGRPSDRCPRAGS